MEKARSSPETYEHEGQRRRYGPAFELWQGGVDITDLIAAESRKIETAFFLAFRLNDYHHGAWKEHPRWWLEHRDLTVSGGQGLEVGNLEKRYNACLDFRHEEVRRHVMAPIVAGAECYDCDGLELDFSRCPPYFRPGEADPAVLTGFIRELRERVAPAFARRGRPVRVMARAFADEGLNAQNGLDWQAWLREGLVEHLTVGGYQWNGFGNDLVPIVQCARSCARRARVYPAFDTITFDLDHTRRYGRAEYLRAAALNYYHQGCDGMYFFNHSSSWLYTYPGPVAASYGHLRELGDPDCIERRNKIYAFDWEHGCRRKVLWDSAKPDDKPVLQWTVRVADDLRQSAMCGDLERVELRVDIALETPWINELNAWHLLWGRSDAVEFSLNGRVLTPGPATQDRIWSRSPEMVAINRNWTRTVGFRLEGDDLPRMGDNTLAARLVSSDPRITGPRRIVVGTIELDVRYAEAQPNDR
jgi:hypothetical protein